MSGILDILNPIKDIGDLVNSVIGKFVTDPTAKLEYLTKLNESQAALQAKAMDLDSQLTDAQAKIITAEATSQSWLPRNIRPLTLLSLLVVILYQAVVVSIFNTPSVNLTAIPQPFWTLFTVGFGGYVVGRSAEKAAFNWSNNNGNGNNH